MRPLQPGDRVSVIAPASPFDRARFETGIAALRSLELEPQISEALFARWPESGHAYLAGDDARRLEELRAALRDPDSKLIVLARGGYGLLRIAGQLSLEEVARSGKPLLGYSDATILHEVWARAGVPSIHGPMCTQLGNDPSALERLARLLFGGEEKALAWDPIRVASAASGQARGILRGGNLATLASLCGTPLSPQLAGAIVLLEDLNEPPYRLDRLCTQLLQSGAFAGAHGFVIGDLWDPNETPDGRAEVIAERLSTLAVPIALGAPFGHANRNQPVALGREHRLDAEAGTLTQLEPLFASTQS